MTAPEPSDEIERLPSRREALGMVLHESRISVAVLSVWTVMAVIVLSFAAVPSWLVYAAPALFVPTAYFLAGLPFRVRNLRERARRRINREMLTRAARELGGVEVDAFRSTFAGRLRHVVRSSRSAFVGGVVLGGLFGLFFLFAEGPLVGIVAGVGWVMVLMLAVVLLALRDALGFDKESAADAQAELAYREAVKDRTQLGGSLQVSVEGGDAHGGLSMRADAGGLEVSEEGVALDFEDTERAQAVARGHAEGAS